MKYFSSIKKNFYKGKTLFDGYSISPNNTSYLLSNFSPGPATINPLVIKDVSKDLNGELIKYGSTPLEISHRSPEFSKILENVNTKIKSFMEIPDEFTIIWTQAGGHGQFSAVPLNMNRVFKDVIGYYLVTGTWSSRAHNESIKFIKSHNLNKSFYETNKNILEYNKLPENLDIPEDADYLYICSNETVNGTEFKESGIKYPTREKLKKTKLVVDMSSDFMMKKINWKNIDVAFACTSKNMGVAGANVVIIRKDLINCTKENKDVPIPCVLDWKLYSDSNSLYNTPAVFNMYLLNKVLDNYIDEMKTIENMEKYNELKAKLFYSFLDDNDIFTPCVTDKKSRSNINIPFIVGDGKEEIKSQFLEHCYNHNVVGLRTKTPFSYESMGLIEPLRISLYNGIKLEDVERIIQVMKAFQPE